LFHAFLPDFYRKFSIDLCMDQNRLSLLALHFIPGIGDHIIRQLISYCGSAEKVFRTPRGKLLKIPGVGSVTADVILKGNPFKKAEKEINAAEKNNVQLLFFTDKNYPARLKHLNDAPSLLYTKGNINFENSKTVGIVGTRKSTDYGKSCIEELVDGLTSHGALIISGLAYGIDIQAHKQALKKGLPTVGVLGSGIDVIYPMAHRDVAKKMEGQGGIVSENPFGTKPDAHNFPSRNRIIAGLSDALVVIEAAEKGGALITSDIANSYNKDVFAFPGNIGRSFSAGCNNLIKSNQAHLITSVKDLEYIMNWHEGIDSPKNINSNTMDLLSNDERAIVMILKENNNPLSVDEISWRSGLTINKLAALLLALELNGTITLMPGKMYKLGRNQ
jgi:DNA processing protein